MKPRAPPPLLVLTLLLLGLQLTRTSHARHQHLSHAHRRRQASQEGAYVLALQRPFGEGKCTLADQCATSGSFD